MIRDVATAEPTLDASPIFGGVQATPPPAMMVDDVSTAMSRASRDRGTLVRLIRQGLVLRDRTVGRNVQGAANFIAEIEALVTPPVNLAIRPRRKRRR